jgi:cytochrome oxidase Cu insertion factor (SCO1/SenC/PrrC family)
MMSGGRSTPRPSRRAFARAVATIGAALLASYAIDRALAQAPDPPKAARLMDDLMWGRGHVGGPFELIDQTGHKRTDRDFRGKLLIVYFGYTYCPDVCPTDLMQIGLAIDKLGAAGALVQPLFISIDPERDTPSVLADYISMFNPRIVGLTGTPAQVQSVADAYKAYYSKVFAEGSTTYLIDHTGLIYLMGRSGEYVGFFPPGTSADRIVEIIRGHLPPSD